jgi:hypothetical protein
MRSQLASPNRFSIGCVSSMQATLPEEPIVQDRLVAARLLKENPGLIGDDPYVACAIGEHAKLRQAIKESQTWVNTPGGPLNLAPLVAVTHSSFLRLADFCDPFACFGQVSARCQRRSESGCRQSVAASVVE